MATNPLSRRPSLPRTPRPGFISVDLTASRQKRTPHSGNKTPIHGSKIMIDTNFSYPRPTKASRKSTNAKVFAVVTVIFAAGFVPNDISYLMLPVLIGLSLMMRRPTLPQSRLFIIFFTLLVCIYGATLGFVRGNNFVFIMKFFAPISVFAALLALRNVGSVLFDQRRRVLYLCFSLTIFFTILIKLRVASGVAVFMKSWTLDLDTATAVSVFHYFALAFCATQIFEFFCIKKTGAGLVRTVLAAITIGCLTWMTATSAFVLAIAVGQFALFARYIHMSILIRASIFVIFVLLIDYFSLQIAVRGFESYLLAASNSDVGNSIRMVQVQYFVRNISLWGEGFGTAHAFPVINYAPRQFLQELEPYGSELPFLNVVNNTGLLGAIWLFYMIKPVFQCFTKIQSRDKVTALRSYFGLACGLVLVGSISNPFFFSPVSMLLLCAAADIRPRSRSSARI